MFGVCRELEVITTQWGEKMTIIYTLYIKRNRPLIDPSR